MSGPDRKAADEPELPRDVLAAIALHALLSCPRAPADLSDRGINTIGDLSYVIADQMLAARERK